MIPDVKPGAPITAAHINKIKRAATRKHTGEGIFETADFVVYRPIGGGVSGGLAMRFVAIARYEPPPSTVLHVWEVFEFTPGDNAPTRFYIDRAIEETTDPETDIVTPEEVGPKLEMQAWPRLLGEDYDPAIIEYNDTEEFTIPDLSDPPLPGRVVDALQDNAVILAAIEIDGTWRVTPYNPPIRVLEFVSERGDYLQCEDPNRLVPDPAFAPAPDVPVPTIPEPVNVAKIWELSKSSLHDQTIDGWLYEYQDDFTRTITKGETTETHAITPRYYPGQEILATRIDLGVMTDPIEDDPSTPGVDESQPGQAIKYAFLSDNRVWAEVTE